MSENTTNSERKKKKKREKKKEKIQDIKKIENEQAAKKLKKKEEKKNKWKDIDEKEKKVWQCFKLLISQNCVNLWFYLSFKVLVNRV